MRINHNLSALNTYARLNQTNIEKSKSLEKLSSGMRINKAGDDAAGLAISEKMRTQIRGLNQASRNAQDGVSMIQTAEGALNETQSLLQRMRELSVQAANDTYTEEDRKEIQNEINQLSSEVNRIAGTTEFNKQLLLNGDYSETSVDGVTTSVEKLGVNAQQAVFEIELTCIEKGANICFDLACADGGGTISFCWTANYSGGISEGVSALASYLRSCGKVSCMWDVQSSGNKLVLTTRKEAACIADNTALNSCTRILSHTNCATCSDFKICTAVQTQEAVCAQINRTYLTLTDSSLKEGLMIEVGDVAAVLYNSACGNYEDEDDMRTKLNLATDVCVIDIFCSASNTVDEVLTCLGGLVPTCATIAVDNTNNRICVVSDKAGQQHNRYSTLKIYGLAGTSSTAGNGKQLQIGANTDQIFTVYFGNMTGTGIGVTTDMSSATIETSSGKTAYFSANGGVMDLDGENTEYALDITTADKATAAISALDDSIQKVSAQRSKLGAFQNRLEHTIINLDTSGENLTAAESRIRDVDMAKEMMEFTKNNILNQAATAMLAQANQTPQGVLQLLK